MFTEKETFLILALIEQELFTLSAPEYWQQDSENTLPKVELLESIKNKL